MRYLHDSSFRLLPILLGSLVLSPATFAAATLDPANEPYNSLAPYELSDTNLTSGTVKAYRPWFENGAWQGDLIEYDVSSGGVLSTTVDFSVNPPTTTDPGNWSARIRFDAAEAADSFYWSTGRKIITFNGVTQVPFLWGNLSATQKAALDNTAFTNGDSSSIYVDYIRGSHSNETQNGGPLRQRFNLLGDIIHSNPVYVPEPNANFALPGYSTFLADNASRPPRVYVGANDGMLHVFDAASGDEVYAYIPSMIVGDLDKLAAQPFVHTYFVDGQLSAGDANFGDNTSPDWHSVLIGSLGAGGKGIFALDITNADLSSQTANTGNDKKVLWEKDGSDADMGYIHGKAHIALFPDNKWYVVQGNGYGSSNGTAKLLLITMDGTVTKIGTDTTTSNGLSAPTLVDIDNDGDVDYAYAGDLQGNLWKFNLQTKAAGIKLFAAGVDKPITTAPDVTRHPNGGVLVFFGTGGLLSAADASDTNTQTLYGIWDDGSNSQVANNTTTLLQQTLASEDYTYTVASVSTTIKIRKSSNTAIDWSTHKGWQVDLNISGERLVTDPVIRAGRLQFVSHNPVTSGRGDAWLVELNYLNGGTGSKIFLDLNADTNLDTNDLASDSSIPVGVYLAEGSFSGPRIAKVADGRDSLFINGLFLPVEATCTVNCSGGFQLGHIDVDTDSPNGGSTATNKFDRLCFSKGNRTKTAPIYAVDSAGIDVEIDANGDPLPPKNGQPVERPGTGAGDGLGGSTDGHQHEYDKAHGQVYVDYLNLEPRCNQPRADDTKTNGLQKLNRFTEVGIGNSKKFFVIVANADLSPGSDLTIGNRKWNVVVYQKMVEKALADWVAGGKLGEPVDENGVSLVVDIDTIISQGTFRNAFNDRAIADGGLIPTQTSCVKGDPYYTMGGSGDPEADKGRWRGGALVTQLISWNDYLTDQAVVKEQTPTDLYEFRDINGTKVYLKEDTTGDGVYDTFYGGLIANDAMTGGNPAFLFESTLFWHYKGSCYGNANWEADVKGALNASSTTSIKDTLAALELDLSNAYAVYDQMVLDGVKQKDLDKQSKLIAELEDKIAQYKAALDDSSVVNSGVPVKPTDATPTLQPSLGPNFRTGRRNWIDLRI